MVSCAIRSCRSRKGIDSKKHTGITFHRFPKNPNTIDIWTRFVNRANWKPTKCSVLCSKHFEAKYFDKGSDVFVRLRYDAIPTLKSAGQKYAENLHSVVPPNLVNPTHQYILLPSSSFVNYEEQPTSSGNCEEQPTSSGNYEEPTSSGNCEEQPTSSENCEERPTDISEPSSSSNPTNVSSLYMDCLMTYNERKLRDKLDRLKLVSANRRRQIQNLQRKLKRREKRKEKEKTKDENIVLTFSALQGSLIKDNENVSENYAVSSADPEKQVEWSNVEAVCRGCLHIKDLKNMKETMVGDLNAIRVYEIITKKQLNMRIPAMMCLECVEKLSKTHKFLLMLESSNRVLENALNEITNLKNDIKEELEDEQVNEDLFLLDCSDAGDESSNDEVPLSQRFKSAVGDGTESFKNSVSDKVVVSATCQICSETVIDLNKHIIENHQLDMPEGINDPVESVNPRKTKGVRKRHIVDEDEEDVGINFEKILKYDKEKVKKLRSKLLTIKDSRKLLPDFKRKVTIYRCKYCIHLEFHGYKDIEIHFKEQHPTDKTCIICEQEFSCFLNALYHMMKKHGKIKCCRLCLVSFKTNDQLMEHYKSDEHNKKCKICNREFKNRKMLYDHRRKYHLNPELMNKKYKCPKCPKEFANHNNIRRHILCFHNMVRYLCDTCGQSYTTNRNLRFHILKFHQGQEVEVKTTRKNYFCETCGRELKIFHKYAIAQHTAKHKGHNYVCRRCHESFATEQEFEAHVEQEGHQLLKCPHCNAEFVREESFNTHLKNHDAPGWNKNYFVRYNKKTSQSRNLNGEFECSYCSKSFKIKQRLDNHIRVHTNERPYKCDYCSKAFKTWIHRKTHLAVHLGIKNYQCRFCSKAFTYASTLRGHEMIHTGERPSTCPECKKGFISTSAMKKHLMTHFRGRHANKTAVLDIQKKEDPDMEISYIDNEIYMESGTSEKQFVKKNQV